MELTVDCDTGGIVVSVRGEIDLYTAPKLDQRLREIADDGYKQVQVDLSDVGYMDSEGIKVLLRLRNSLGTDGLVTVKGASGTVLRVLQISGLPKIIQICD